MNYSKQRGVVLIVCLVILAVVTLLGLATMESTGLEMKMSSNMQERQVAFNAAEAGLLQAESVIQNIGFTRAQLQTGCVGSACFESTCTDGLCFVGNWPAASNQSDCVRYTTASPPAIQVWEDTVLDVWNTAGRHVTVPIAGNANDAKYIIEFLCFIETLGSSGNDVSSPPGSGDVLYRITALGTSDSGKSDVMLQTTYRAPNP